MILGIESSCDESALALYHPDKGVVGDWVHSQIVKHSEYGGVVPDIAVLEHLNNFPPLLNLVGEKYNLAKIVSQISVTCGPGLVGCLGIGISVAKSLGMMWEVPVVGVNHLRGHAFSPFMSLGDVSQWRDLLPHLGLLVSGGNTLLFSINEELKISILAKTVDDAVGEALDKGAKLLGIPYPGGAELERRSVGGNHREYDFPIAFPKKNDMKFSFSGLKTSLLYTIQKMNETEVNHHFADLSASYQWAAVQQLVRKTRHAWNYGEFKSLGLSGGVANNKVLRSQMKDFADHSGAFLLCAEPKYTGDNASMIAYASFVDPDGTWFNKNQKLSFNASLRLEDLPS